MASWEEIIPRKKYRLYVELGYLADGKRDRRTRTVAANGPRKADELLKAFEQEVKESRHLENDNPTFTEFVARWRTNFAEIELDIATRETYETMLKVLVPYFKRKRIKEITTYQIVQFFTKEKEDGRGSLEKKYNVLMSFFKHAVAWKIIDKNNNPMDGVNKPKIKKTKVESDQFFSTKEIPVLLDKMGEMLDYQYLISGLAFFGGLRRGEVLGIADDVINWDSNQIRICRSLQLSRTEGLKLKSTKTEDERTVTYPSFFMEKLLNYYNEKLNLITDMGDLWNGFKDPNGKEVTLLFTNEYGKPFRPDSVTQFWDRFTTRYELGSVSFHGLRHSSASYLLHEGANIKVIQKRLGHKDIKTTLNMYSHITEDDDQSASVVFDKLNKTESETENNTSD